MPSISLQVLRFGDDTGALLNDETVAEHTTGDGWRAVLLEGGMSSGDPAVAVIVPLGDGRVAVHETSLLAFQAAARGLVAMAETQFGWTMPA